jgi:hypothetical protein
MKMTSPAANGITSIHLRQRAIHYRFAAAMSDVPREIETFVDLATMFEQLAEQFARVEIRTHAS